MYISIGPDIEKFMGTGLQICANLVVTTHHYYDNFIEIHVELQIYANWSSNLWEPSSRVPLNLDL